LVVVHHINDQAGERARQVGLFRYVLIRDAADPTLTTKQRGALIRAIADTEHVGPFGTPARVSRATVDRWIRAWRRGGFDALVPSPRHVAARTPAEVLELAVALKREVPARTGAQITEILRTASGWAPHERTVQRHFVRLGLTARPDGTPPQAFGRFEATAVNEMWTGDALHGPRLAGRKAILFAFIDDFSRALVGYRWAHREDTVRLEAALRAGMAARGLPQRIYVDNGSAFVSSQLLRACATLGVKLTHSKPRRPQGRGKIERVFRTVREQFLVELSVPGRTVNSLDELNRLFTAYVETVYHRRVHSETGQTPLARLAAAPPPAPPTPAHLREAFLWSETRTVTKTATVSLHGNVYVVDAALVGRRIEVVFDPFDMATVDIRLDGRSMGAGAPHRIDRHVHPHAAVEPAPPPAPTGIDYLALVEANRDAELARHIDYRNLATDAEPALPPRDDGELPGQLDLTDLTNPVGDGEREAS
jgi:putative transposase